VGWLAQEGDYMATVIGEVTGRANTKRVLFLEALQKAFESAPSPPQGFDVQHFRLVSVEFEYGGFVNSTKTRITIDVENGPLP